MKSVEFVLLALGAVAGAYVRYRVVQSPLAWGSLPLNVLIVNVVGSFILGVFAILASSWNWDIRYSMLVAVGFCGSLTTMSSFALETSNLLDNNQLVIAVLNILVNVSFL